METSVPSRNCVFHKHLETRERKPAWRWHKEGLIMTKRGLSKVGEACD